MIHKRLKVPNGAKKFILVIIAFIVVPFGISELSAEFFTGERLFLIEEKILLKNLPKDTSDLRLWIPYPISDDFQQISDFKIDAPRPGALVIDKEYGNKFIYVKAGQKDLLKDLPGITLSFKVLRKELKHPDSSNASRKSLSRFLKSDRLVPVNGGIKKIAREITQAKAGDFEKVRAIYDHIIDELTYSKDDPKVCGIGDSLLTLQYKKGICTDYHSLFISLVRSLGIPAKFEIGFPIPEDKEEGRINGYHCWAKFYIKGKGWIPVDISEADKHPEKRDYFFGHIDENRVHLTSGRDVTLKDAQDAQPINFVVYPYAEAGGVQFTDMEIELAFRDLKGGDSGESQKLTIN